MFSKKVTLSRYQSFVCFIEDKVNAIFRDLNPRVKAQDAKLNLILDHLKLKYVPETETKEPAKLVEETTVGSLMYVPDTPPTKPKKKRGRPKKK